MSRGVLNSLGWYRGHCPVATAHDRLGGILVLKISGG